MELPVNESNTNSQTATRLLQSTKCISIQDVSPLGLLFLPDLHRMVSDHCYCEADNLDVISVHHWKMLPLYSLSLLMWKQRTLFLCQDYRPIFAPLGMGLP